MGCFGGLAELSGADVTAPQLPITLCYARVLPDSKSAFRAGFWPDRYRESAEVGPVGRPEGRFLFFPNSRPAKIRPGRPIFDPEAVSRNIEYTLG